MIIESTLTPKEFARHALSRHFRRPAFHLYAFIAAAVTTYILFQDEPINFLLLFASWLPLLIHTVGGLVTISRRSRDSSLPLYLPTRYELDQSGIQISSRNGRSMVPWSDVRGVRKYAGVYELTLTSGQLLVISRRAVSPHQARGFEDLIMKQITPRPQSEAPKP